ncbi:hypothetical protein L6164_002529 [Bauhinia variegata]|uniref:Uncharacterized protein n=1 Tax=Bauhinia variegata TaxID=167791 RepID=A0ACB9PXY0_BAUVA|nr:hypothetical protein L6164_002529 [Bauhinia variegata]
MAYRRRQGISRASTFKEEIYHRSSSDDNNNNIKSLSPSYSFSPSSSSTSSLAAQAIKASTACRDSNTFSYSDPSDHLRSKGQGFYAYGDATGRSESKSGFWGVLAQKAKAILEDDSFSSHSEMPDRFRSQPLNASSGTELKREPSYESFEASRKIDNPTFRKGLDAITSSLNQLGDTFEKAFEEGRTIVESKTADLRTQIKRKGSGNEDPNQASGFRSAWQQASVQPGPAQNPTNHETQLKASRDVAMATAAKAKLLLRELKTVKADLVFAKARCAQLEEENKLLRDTEGREKGHTRADDDLIRLQLETLLAEKARLASENEIYARENRFLREIVEYHQLTMQDVVYLDEGMEEVTEVYPIDANGIPRLLSSTFSPPSPEDLQSASPPVTKEIFPVPEDKSKSQAEAPPSIGNEPAK